MTPYRARQALDRAREGGERAELIRAFRELQAAQARAMEVLVRRAPTLEPTVLDLGEHVFLAADWGP
ncbi:MAG: hypothetical protein R3266_10600, partial [Gemmatimonadota bacterium]|nr:hypothetical protein [Gemmatimonadota bacterium]